MHRLKKAFTLIELLVVIAIIAILAAILFPVFAQAKEAAKKSVTISNNKQLILGALQYMNDNDDKFMIAAYNNSYNANPANPDSVPLVMDYPYIKNMGIMMDPMDPATKTDRDTADGDLTAPSSTTYPAAQELLNFAATADWGINYPYFNPTYIVGGLSSRTPLLRRKSPARPKHTWPSAAYGVAVLVEHPTAAETPALTHPASTTRASTIPGQIQVAFKATTGMAVGILTSLSLGTSLAACGLGGAVARCSSFPTRMVTRNQFH